MKTIQLTKQKETIVDDKDYESLMKYKWCFNSSGYAMTTIKKEEKYKALYLHRYLLSPTKEQQVDHVNSNKLDNRRKNLRLCTGVENKRNTSKWKTRVLTSRFKGVHYQKGLISKPWMTQIRIHDQTCHLGTFKTEIEAACMYNFAAQRVYKLFTNLNKIPKDFITTVDLDNRIAKLENIIQQAQCKKASQVEMVNK